MFDKLLKGAEAIQAASKLPVGLTPKEEVWSLNKTKLYRYIATKPEAERHKTPLLLVYSLVNKPYVFDLRPKRSLIEFLVERGFDVFLLDWGTPGIEDKDLGIDGYIEEYLPRAVRAVQNLSKSKELFLLGYCVGAVQSLIYAALHPEVPLKGLVLLTAPVDFSVKERGAFVEWLSSESIDVDRMVRMLGNIPAEMVEFGAKMLRPVDNYIGTYSALFDKLDDEASVEGWQALHRWVHDGVPFTGEAFRQWVEQFVRGNQLMEGKLLIRGKRVDLTQVKLPLLNVVAEQDHIVPPAQSLSLMDKISSEDKEVFRMPAGHVGLVIGRTAKQGLWPKLDSWLSAHEAKVE